MVQPSTPSPAAAPVTLLAGLREIRASGQVVLPTGKVSPLVCAPEIGSETRTTKQWVSMVEAWPREDVQRLLAEHGALLLRGFPVETAQDFSDVLHGLKWTPHKDIGNPVKRTIWAPNVANANEGPPDLEIKAHSEFGISGTHFPSNICFWAKEAPELGGESPINDGAWLLQRLKEEVPEFVADLAVKGVTYTIYHPPTQLSQDANGNGVMAAWGEYVLPDDDEVTIKRKIEDQIQSVSPTTTWRWMPDGGLFTMQRTPAFRVHPLTGKPVVFGNISSYYGGTLNRGTLEPPYLDATGFYKPPPLFGDDSPIPLKYLELYIDLIHEIRTMVRWQKHDLIIIDNIGTQHSRMPWQKGDRKILASLWDSGLEKEATIAIDV